MSNDDEVDYLTDAIKEAELEVNRWEAEVEHIKMNLNDEVDNLKGLLKEFHNSFPEEFREWQKEKARLLINSQ